MTKMICVKKGAWTTFGGKPFKYRAPNYGETVTVIGKRKAQKASEETTFILAEYTETGASGVRVSFWAKHFREVKQDEPKACSKAFLDQLRKAPVHAK